MDGIQEIVFLDPLLSVGGGRLAYRKPYSCVCDGGARIQANQVDFRPPFDKRGVGVVVLEPEEAEVRLLFVRNGKLVEHVFHVGGDGIWMTSEPVDDST